MFCCAYGVVDMWDLPPAEQHEHKQDGSKLGLQSETFSVVLNKKMRRPDFYWDDKPYPFDAAKKYLVFVRGCYCPPHKGHVDTIEQYINHPNVTIVISQMARENRHGVPPELSQKIWKLFIDRLVPDADKHRVILTSSGNRTKLKQYMTDTDVLVYVRGNEFATSKKSHAGFEKHVMKKHKNFLNMLHEMHIMCDYVFLDRPLKKTLSATKFVAAVNAGASSKEVFAFLPDRLPVSDKKYIVRKLRMCDLKV